MSLESIRPGQRIAGNLLLVGTRALNNRIESLRRCNWSDSTLVDEQSSKGSENTKGYGQYCTRLLYGSTYAVSPSEDQLLIWAVVAILVHCMINPRS